MEAVIKPPPDWQEGVPSSHIAAQSYMTSLIVKLWPGARIELYRWDIEVFILARDIDPNITDADELARVFLSKISAADTKKKFRIDGCRIIDASNNELFFDVRYPEIEHVPTNVGEIGGKDLFYCIFQY